MRADDGWGPCRPVGRWVLLTMLAAIQVAGCSSPPAVSDALAPATTAITDFWTIETTESVTVIVRSDRPLTYTASRQERPLGIVFRFPAARLEGLGVAYFPPENPVVRSIRTAETKNNGESRVLLELALDAPYEVVSDKEGLKIVFRKSSVAAASIRLPALSGVGAPEAEHIPARPVAAEPVKAGPGPEASMATAVVLREVRTETRAEGVLIRVIADGRVKLPTVFTLENPARIVFDFMGLKSAIRGEQRLSVRSEWVTHVRHHGYPDKVRLVADTDVKYLKSYSVEPTAEGILITVGGLR